MSYDFKLINVDTDSIMIGKSDGSSFSIEEQKLLLDELNGLFPESINWDEDGYFEKVIIIKAKNYILFDGETRKIKGSSIRDSKKEPALREMMEKVIQTLILNDNLVNLESELQGIYNSYIKEVLNIKDIHRWCQKKTITKPILACLNHESLNDYEKKEKKIRKNESNIWDAVKDIEGLQEGDKAYVYPAILAVNTKEISDKKGKVKIKKEELNGLKIDQNWNQDHNVIKLLRRVIDTMYIFESVIKVDNFIDYSLKKNSKLLENFRE